MMHWGDPYATKPSEEQKQIANFLIENGANVILGNHPAAIQPMEIKKNKQGENVFIAYSLGNYISSINNDISKVELVLNIELRKSSIDGKVTLSKVDYTPIYVLDNGEKAQNRYELIDMKGVAKEYAWGNTNIVDKKYLIMPDMRRRQDAATWLQILKAGYKCYGLNEVLGQYRRTDNSLSSNKIKAAKGVWHLYRKTEKLSLAFSCYCFAWFYICCSNSK